MCKSTKIHPYLLAPNILLSFGYKKALLYDLRGKYVQLIWFDTNEVKKLKDFIFYKKITPFIKELYTNTLSIPLDKNAVKRFSFDLKEKIDFSLFSFAWIEVTNKCNFNCIHCYGDFTPKNFNILTLDDIKLISKELKSINIKNIQLIGGEPLLVPNLKKIILELKKYFESIEVFTNGFLINSEWASFFKKNKIKVAMSVYSHQENIHNSITQNHLSFKNLKDVINILNKKGINYRIAYIKTRYNDISTVEDLRKTFNAKFSIKEDIIRIVGRASEKYLSEKLTKEKEITLNNFMNSYIESSWVKRNFFKHNCFSYKIYIDSLLDVYPCVMERRKKYGNLKNLSLIDMLKINSNVVNLTKDDINECSFCEFRYVCFDCRPDFTNSFLSKPKHCKYNPYKGVWYD